MIKLFAMFGAVVAGVMGIFTLNLVSTFFGGVSLWIIGGVFEYIPDLIREYTYLEMTNFQLGATIGFSTSIVRSMFYRSD